MLAPFRSRAPDGPIAGATIPRGQKAVNTASSAGIGRALAALGDRDEGDLPGPDHAQAHPGQPFQVLGIAEPLDLLLEAVPLLLQRVEPTLQGFHLGLLREVLAERNDRGGGQDEDDRREDGGPGGQADPSADLGPGGHRALPRGIPPAYRAISPSSCSIRRSRLYLAVRSPRDGAPALICPAPVATARSAMVVSSVSPDRCEITRPKPASAARVTTSRVSVSVPIWLGFTRIALAARARIPASSRSGFVTNRSSPTIWHRPPRASVAAVHPSQSSSPSGSSIDSIGKRSRRSEYCVTSSSRLRSCPSRRYRSPSRSSLAATSRARTTSSPGSSAAASIAPTRSSHAAAVSGRSGANPPSSPTPVESPRSWRRDLSAWKISEPHRNASEYDAAPTGASMNSWTSRELSAWAPPLIKFRSGVGSRCADGPPRYRYSGRPRSAEAAWATASDTPRMAFAPSFDLSEEPSASSMTRS